MKSLLLRWRKALLIVAAALVAVAGFGFWYVHQRNNALLTTPYQAVLLSNGSAYFGRLEGLGTAFPVLKEVYYVQTRAGQDPKQPVSVLVKRGREWHSPDRMILNANTIVFIEPVKPGSRVAQLIADAAGQ